MYNPFIFNLPIPKFGKILNGCYNAGPMLADDSNGATTEDSKMQIVANVSKADFFEYLQLLKNNGYTFEQENRIGDNYFADFSNYHLAYYNAQKELRLILDKIKFPFQKFNYKFNGPDNSALYQYKLIYDKNNVCTETTVNCGMFYIIHLSDNSLVMIDGGHRLQWNNSEINELWRFLRKITDTAETEKIRIAAWFFTHAHDDHTDGCIKLLDKFKDYILLERVMFNFPFYPDFKNDYSRTSHEMKKKVSLYYPEVMQMKLHTGQKINLADAEFEVMYTHEDAVLAKQPDIFPLENFNCTSTILRLTLHDKSIIILGDTNVESENVLKRISSPTIWKSDAVQVAHHCFNYLDTLYEWIAAPLALIPNSYYAAHTVENSPKLDGVLRHMPDKTNIYYEGTNTYGFHATEDKWELVK